MIKVVCMGDSITEGFGVEPSESYPSVLQNILGEEYRVVNKGVCCTTTLNVENEKGIMGMPYMREARYQEALQEKGNIYVVLLGTNDAQDGMDDTQDFKYEQNDMISRKADFVPCYRQILQAVKAASPGAVIYAGLPIPVQNCIWRKHQESYLKEIRACIKEAAAAEGVSLLDIEGAFAALPKEEQLKLYQEDNLHPNKEGYKLIARTVAGVLKNKRHDFT